MPITSRDLEPRASTSPRTSNHLRRRRVLRWLKRSVLAVIALAIIGAIGYAWMPAPTRVDVAAARRAPLEVTITEDGQTRVRDRYVVAAPTSGDLERIALTPGVRVVVGQELARIAPPSPLLIDARARREATARLALATARRDGAAVAIARAITAQDLAVKDAARARVLAARGAITIEEFEHAEAAAEVAIQDRRRAEFERTAAAAEVVAARAILDERPTAGAGPAARIPVAAPASGTILRVLRDSAGPVATGSPLLELGDPRALEVVVDVLSSDAARITPGMPVWIERWGGDDALRAEVARVEPSAFTRISALGVDEQRVRVIARLPAPPAALGDGFRVAARIVTWRGEDVLVVPASAVFKAAGRWTVYVVRAGHARLTPVELGHRGMLDVEVLRGLEAGERVITHPGDHVTDGARVEVR